MIYGRAVLVIVLVLIVAIGFRIRHAYFDNSAPATTTQTTALLAYHQA